MGKKMPPNKRMQPTPLTRLVAMDKSRLQAARLRGSFLRRRGAADARVVRRLDTYNKEY